MAGCCRRRCARCRGRGTALRCRRSLRARGRLAGRPHRRMLSRRACREPGAAPCGQGVPNMLAGTQALNSKAPAALGIASPDEFSGEARHMHCYRTQTGGPQHRLVHEPRLPSSGAIAPWQGLSISGPGLCRLLQVHQRWFALAQPRRRGLLGIIQDSG